MKYEKVWDRRRSWVYNKGIYLQFMTIEVILFFHREQLEKVSERGCTQPKFALNLHLICIKKVIFWHWIWVFFGTFVADVAH